MALNKVKLGQFLIQHDTRNSDNKLKNVMGISVRKEFREPTSKVNKNELKNYKLVCPNQFAAVPTTHNEKCFAFAYNDTQKIILVSSINTVFSVDEKYINPRWLQMYFNRSEFDCYARFNSWGSAREVFSWEELCSVEIELPDLATQQKYVDIYLGMVANQKAYERGLDDLKLTCDGYIEDLRRKLPCEPIGKYLKESTIRVKDVEKKYCVDQIMGISSIDKCFMHTKADTDGLSLNAYKIVPPRYISFNPNTARMGDRIPVALNTTNEDYLVSAIYPVFSVNENKLSADYLMMWIKRMEFDRYARYNSWGSAREMFNFDDMCEVQIPIPDIKVQQAIADIYKVYIERKEINVKLKSQIKTLCPILIKGSLQEGR